ncbi:hypothetical protein [Succinimonas amylolytica]|uniref:hypothetical protein n=1 Tax=Succinimonas amylolytica TaxID=83769 RepID=UPI0023A8EB00
MTKRSDTEKKLRLAVVFFMMAVMFLMGTLITSGGILVVAAFIAAASGAMLITVFMRELYCYKGISGQNAETITEDAELDDDCDEGGNGVSNEEAQK